MHPPPAVQPETHILDLARGGQLSTPEIAALTGLTVASTRQLMYGVSRVTPIYYEHGLWRALDDSDC